MRSFAALATTSRPTGRARRRSPPSKNASDGSRKSLTLPTFSSSRLTEQSNGSTVWQPHEYQKKAVRWLLTHPAAGLFLDLGLGKTAITLEAFCALRRAGKAKAALVLCPRRPAQLVWSHSGEVGKWAQFQGLRVALLHGDDKDDVLDDVEADLYVLNYDGLAWFSRRKGFQTLLIKRGVDVLICDELSKLKHGKKTLRFKCLKPWLGRFARRWGLTGSPASRCLLDLFGQIYTLDLGVRLGAYVTKFRDEFFYPTGFGGYTWAPRPGADVEITARLSDLVLAMRSQDYLDLPPLVERNVWVDLPPEARRVYDELEADLLARLEDHVITAKNAAVASGKCCQVASGGVYYDTLEGAPATAGDFTVQRALRSTVHLHEAKTEALLDLVEERQGSPLVVLYEYQHDLERLRKALPDATVLAGGTSDKEADRIVKAWNATEIPVLLAQPMTMSTGLNLQAAGCGHVVFYTVPWDRETYDQVIGRFRRQGTTVKTVMVHRLLTRDTVDEAKVKSLAAKDRTQRAVFNALISLCTTRLRRRTKEQPTEETTR